MTQSPGKSRQQKKPPVTHRERLVFGPVQTNGPVWWPSTFYGGLPATRRHTLVWVINPDYYPLPFNTFQKKKNKNNNMVTNMLSNTDI